MVYMMFRRGGCCGGHGHGGSNHSHDSKGHSGGSCCGGHSVNHERQNKPEEKNDENKI